MRPREPPPDDAFDNQVIRGPRRADSNSEVDLPFGRDIEIDRRKELLLLIAHRIKPCNRSVGSVVLQAACNLLGKVIAELDVRRKSHASVHARTVERSVKRWIKRQVPASDFLVDN